MATATTYSKTMVQLDLSEDEAAALSAVIRQVGGDPFKTRRGLISSVDQALRTLDIRDRIDDTEGTIYFQEVIA